MSDVATFIRNAWYVAGWDTEVDTAPLARTICGVPMMFYRRLDRAVVAMRDACPHRLLPLSMGLREDDSIRCKYHGLKIGSDVIDTMTPESATSMHYFWGMARSFDVDDMGFTARFRTAQSRVFAEDVEILEAQQRSIVANPQLRLNAYPIDHGGARARQIIARKMREQTPVSAAAE